MTQTQTEKAILGLKQFLSQVLGPGMFYANEARESNGYVGQYDDNKLLHNICIHQVAKNIPLTEGGSMMVQYWEVTATGADDGFLVSNDWRLFVD